MLANQAKGDLLHKAKELLIANDLLAAKILRDQMQYSEAYIYANHALFEAESIEDDEFAATARYTRGCITLHGDNLAIASKKDFTLRGARLGKQSMIFRKY